MDPFNIATFVWFCVEGRQQLREEAWRQFGPMQLVEQVEHEGQRAEAYLSDGGRRMILPVKDDQWCAGARPHAMNRPPFSPALRLLLGLAARPG